jgi:hypothetical protein
MILGVLLPGLFLVWIFFYGIASGETDNPLWIGSMTLMIMLVVFFVYVYHVTVGAY